MGNEHETQEDHEHTQILTQGTVTLTLEDDSELDCEIITEFEVNSKLYIALSPSDSEDGEVWIYRFTKDETGGEDHQLDVIEDDEEYEIVADAFDEWLDEQEFNEMDEEIIE